MQINLYIPSVPVAQPRARATIRGGHAGVFTPTRIKSTDGTSKPHPIAAFKASVRHEASLKYSGPPLEGPLCFGVLFVFPRPQSMVWKSREMPRARHVKKPDIDNLVKACLDALNGLLWRDDAQVITLMAAKCIASGTEQPHVEIGVSEASEAMSELEGLKPCA